MQVGPLQIDAVSVGGLETCIELPAWDLAFDIGRCPPTAVKRSRLLLTHCHMDHAGGLAYHTATRDLLHLPPPTYYVPRENFADLTTLLETWRRLDHSDIPCTLVPLAPGERADLGKGLTATAFRSPHRVPCQGYAISQRRTRLRPDLAGFPQEEIRRRRLAGETVAVESDTVELAFTGDTLIEVVEREESVRTARVLVMEVTFLDERVPVDKARDKGHVHLDEVIARADLFRNEAILFTHFSARYGPAEVRSILRRRLPESLRDRVVALVPSD